MVNRSVVAKSNEDLVSEVSGSDDEQMAASVLGSSSSVAAISFTKIAPSCGARRDLALESAISLPSKVQIQSLVRGLTDRHSESPNSIIRVLFVSD